MKTYHATMAIIALNLIFAPVTSVLAGTTSQRAIGITTEGIKHGQDISASMVGPAAAGFGSLESFAGATIRDGESYPFAKQISGSAVYDGFTVDGPHLLIEGVHFTSGLDIYATQPVVFRGVAIRVEGRAHWGIHTRPTAGPFYFLWSESGAASTAGAPHDLSNYLQMPLYLRGENAIVYRSHISKAVDGIRAYANHQKFIENLIDELIYWDFDHNDGIQMDNPVHDISILRNKILNRNSQTSCITVAGTGILVEANYLSGGGWVIYGGYRNNGHPGANSSEIKIVDNVFGREFYPKSGQFGAIAYWGPSPSLQNEWARNRFSTGQAIWP
jgi:hypothetical protein